MVNVPNWLHLDLRFAEGQWWSEGGMKPSDERVELDLRRGLLTRTLVLTEADEDPGADQPPRSLEITQRRLVSLRYRHLGAQETRIVSRGFSGRLHVRTGVDLEIDEVEIEVQVETKGPDHCARVLQHLRDDGFRLAEH